jgi:predicted  nucleic acid-binding Zn-ribbon protein
MKKSYRTHSNTYTSEEINGNISKLTKAMEALKNERSEITKSINKVNRQIQYWESLDESQTKLF